jgi:hypothetical protein
MLTSGVRVVKERKRIVGVRKFCWTRAASGTIGGGNWCDVERQLAEAWAFGAQRAAPLHELVVDAGSEWMGVRRMIRIRDYERD